MKKALKLVGYVLATVVALVALALISVYLLSNRKLNKSYPVSVQPVVIPTGSEALGRGQLIAATRGCADCHGADLAGATIIDNPAMGRLSGPNLTRGRGGLPASFTDIDLVRSIRHGVAPDGRGLFLMPSSDFSEFTDQDMGDLIAYIDSLAPVDRASVPLTIGPVARGLLVAGKIKLSAELIDHAGVRPATVQPGVTVAYGHYLAAGCTGCHGPNLSGGKIDIGPPDWPPAQNLTPAGDLAKWSEADFIMSLRKRTRPDGSPLNEVMPAAFGLMNDTELKAIWAYLRTLPPAPTGKR